MFDFQEKRRIRSLVYSKVTVGILLALTLMLSVSVYERYSVEREMAEKRDAKAEELKDLEERKVMLEGKVEHLKESRGVEEELRSRFDVAKEGEKVIVIVGKDQEARAGSVSAEIEEEEGSFFSFFKFW